MAASRALTGMCYRRGRIRLLRSVGIVGWAAKVVLGCLGFGGCAIDELDRIVAAIGWLVLWHFTMRHHRRRQTFFAVAATAWPSEHLPAGLIRKARTLC